MNEWRSGFDSQVFNLQLKTFMWSHNIRSKLWMHRRTKQTLQEWMTERRRAQWTGNGLGDDARILSVVQNTNKLLHVILYTAVLQTGVNGESELCFLLLFKQLNHSRLCLTLNRVLNGLYLELPPHNSITFTAYVQCAAEPVLGISVGIMLRAVWPHVSHMKALTVWIS